jgi:hypothetical protein
MNFGRGSTTEAHLAKEPKSAISTSAARQGALVAYQTLTGRESCLAAGIFIGWVA